MLNAGQRRPGTIRFLPRESRAGTYSRPWPATSSFSRRQPGEQGGSGAGRETCYGFGRREITVSEIIVEMSIVHLLYERACSIGDIACLEDALSRARRVAAGLAESGVRHLGVSAELGRCLSLRYRLLGDTGSLWEAIVFFRAEVSDADPLDSDLPACLNSLGNALADWYQLTRDPGVLAEVEGAFRRAAESVPEADPRLSAILTGLGDAVLSRYLADGRLSDLDEAIAVAERAAAAASPGDRGRAIVLNGLANVLAERYRRTGDGDALARAVLVLRQAAAEAIPGSRDRALALSGLGIVLNRTYEATGNRDALAEAERVAAESVALTPPGDPARGNYLNNLGGIRWNMYLESGDPRDQVESAAAYRAAVAALPESHDQYAQTLANLAGALVERHETAGDLRALEEGVAALRRSTELMQPLDPRRASSLSRLGSALLRLYERLGDTAVLDEAENAARRAVRGFPGDVERPMFLSDLSNILYQRYKDSRDSAALDEAEAVLRGALDSTTDGERSRLLIMSNLGHVLIEQYRRSQRMAVLDEAIDVLRRAARRAAHGDIHRPIILSNLGEALRRRHSADPAPDVLAEGLEVLGEAAAALTAAPRQRAKAARSMGDLAASVGSWQQAADAYRLSVGLLPAVASQELDRSDKEHELAGFTMLACDAAAAALRAGDAHQAVSLLEGGRGVLFAQALRLRSPLDELRAIAPGTADRFQHLSRQLSAAAPPQQRLSPGEPGLKARILDATNRIARLQQASRDQDQLLAQIRGIKGFEDFMRPPTPRQVLDDAGAGPVALLNLSRHRSDALILSKGSIRVVPLPAATPQAAAARAVEFTRALATAASPAARQRNQAEARLLEVLDWLWHAITKPVLDAIPAPEATRPRLWWVPTGPLSVLPLHAAESTGPRQSAASRVISSYAPTIQALGKAARKHAHAANGRTLVVTVPSAPGAPPLPEAHAEGQAVARLAPRHTLLTGAAATRDRLLRELPLHDNFHFAGHAVGNLDSPAASALLMHDRPVTARDLSQLQLTDAKTAYLSACETAASEIGLIDEAISIASACQLAGFQHVIATLWPIYDSIAITVAKHIWQAAKDTGEHPAISVDNVTRDLRQKHPRKPSIWAAYIHVGS
jgi:CHAT domain-containing protein